MLVTVLSLLGLAIIIFVFLDMKFKWVFFKKPPPAWADSVVGMPNLLSENQVGWLSPQGVKSVYVDNPLANNMDIVIRRNEGLDIGYKAAINSINGLGYTSNINAGDFYCVWVEDVYPSNSGPALKMWIDKSSPWYGTIFDKVDEQTGRHFILTADRVLGLMDNVTPFPIILLPGGDATPEQIGGSFRAAADHILAEFNEPEYHQTMLLTHRHFFYPKSSGTSLVAESNKCIGCIDAVHKYSDIKVIETFKNT